MPRQRLLCVLPYKTTSACFFLFLLYFPVDDKWVFLVAFFLTVFVTGSCAPYGHFCLLVKSSLLPVYLAKPG